MKKNVAILGATGMVGQQFIRLLIGHPYFQIKDLIAQKEFFGKEYQKVCHWIVSPEMPEEIKKMKIKRPEPKEILKDNVEIVFSALPADVARELEPKFAQAGLKVFSNAATFRMEKDVPLLIAEVNPESLDLIKVQQKRRKWKGFIVCNPNCTTIILALVLKPIFDHFGIERLIVSTMQAVSGAGYPGVSSLDIIDNVIPYIKEEEEKVKRETLKILNAHFKISPSCHRGGAIDGHLEDLHLSLKREASIEEIKKVLDDFGKSFPKLPTSPKKLIIVREEIDRPQPRLDRLAGKGMAITVGRIRKDEALENGIKMNILGHNTIRGAAGQSVLNAEFWLKVDPQFKLK